jgi:hypothetical protein
MVWQYIFASVLMVSVFSFLSVASWADARRKEREAYYKSELLKKIAENTGAGASSAIEVLREDERIRARRGREGVKMGGLVLTGIGLGLAALLRGLEHREPIWLAGTIPLLIGVALLFYTYVLSPKE